MKAIDRTAWLALAAGALFFASSLALLAAPAAGTVIGNQATATYNDAGGTSRTTISNLVQTTITQVKSFTLTANGARSAAPGQTVYYPHTITDTGNGTDTYALNPPSSTNFGAAGPHGSLQYFSDVAGRGLPDNATPITTSGAIAAGRIFRFVVAGTVPAAAANASSADIVVRVSDTTPATATNTDTTIGHERPLAREPAHRDPRLYQHRHGGSEQRPVHRCDSGGHDLCRGLRALERLGRGGTHRCERWRGAGGGVSVRHRLPPVRRHRDRDHPPVPPGALGTLTLQVTVNANFSLRTLSNTAQSTQPATNANTASYTVLQTAVVEANGSPTSSAAGAGEPVTVASAAAGSTLTFANYIWNRGSGTDTFDITIAAKNFPPGTTVTLLQQHGVTPLINTGGSPVPDTGPVPGAGAACAPPFVADTGVTPAVCGTAWWRGSTFPRPRAWAPSRSPSARPRYSTPPSSKT